MKIFKSKLFPRIYFPISLFLFSSCLSENKEKVLDPDLYAEHIRTTEFQSPEDELASFVLPEGFKVTLFASEPDIAKPINMEFDHQGRLWVTQSTEYPIAAGDSGGLDKISVLEDTNGDGKADKITDFAENLNIPIGILPVHDGVIAYSIPNLVYFKDADGDSKADGEPKVLLGPFGHEDTHGMVNNLTRGYDGWVYACHGFTNTSEITAADGHGISMTSGNTFRFKEDGSRVEQTTYGRVNPFGFAFDEWGYLYSSDCHSKPIYQLIPQGDYPHFGKIPPALGFAPEMMGYNLGSTALAGLSLYTSDQFPKEYQNCFYSGDVVTCRIDRNTMTFDGSTPIAQKKEPLLISRDPWFRPVDVKVGPDGALYVADFYNRIIGHYEVPLDHKDRDRTSGRIWKITYEGEENDTKHPSPKEDIQYYLQKLSSTSLKTRMDATNFIVDHWSQSAVAPLNALLQKVNVDTYAFVHGLWALHRLGALKNGIINQALEHSDPLVQVHGIRIIKEMPLLSAEHQQKLLAIIANSENPHVKRAIAEVFGHFPSASHLVPLMNLYSSTKAADTHLKYTAILAVQLNLKNASVLKSVVSLPPANKSQFKVLYSALLDLPSENAAEYLLENLNTFDLGHSERIKITAYLARSISSERFDRFIKVIKSDYATKNKSELGIIRAIEEGITQRGGIESKFFDNWIKDLSKSILSDYSEAQTLDDQEHVEPLVWAIDKMGEFQIDTFQPKLKVIFSNRELPLEMRVSSANAMLKIDRNANLDNLLVSYRSKEETDEFKIAMTPVFNQIDKKVLSGLSSNLVIRNRMLQTAIAKSLSKKPVGIDTLLNAVEAQTLRIDVLNGTEIKDVLEKNLSIEQRKRFEALKLKFEKEIKNITTTIDQRITAFVSDDAQKELGMRVFTENCIICHQVAGKGQVIGPQLDGIGNWGLEALIVKVLDPNRNISQSFRNYSITLKDGKSFTGLFRRQEGEAIVFADVTGNEFKVNQKNVVQQTPTGTTLMPDQFRNTINEKDFNGLMNYLLSLK